MNSWKDGGVTTSPWLHLEALPAIREALRLRLRLMPYLYSAMVLAHEAHVPVLAPTFFVFEDDPATSPTPTPRCSAPACSPRRSSPKARARSRPTSRRGPKAGATSGPARQRGRPERRDPGAAGPAAAARAGRRDRARDRQRRRHVALHDEPSRALRVSGRRRGHPAPLVEDDGLPSPALDPRDDRAGLDGERVRVEVSASGDYPLPYPGMRVILPGDERRTVELCGRMGSGCGSRTRLHGSFARSRMRVRREARGSRLRKIRRWAAASCRAKRRPGRPRGGWTTSRPGRRPRRRGSHSWTA